MRSCVLQVSEAYIMATTVELCWTGMFSDPHTGVESYRVTVTERATASEVASFEGVGAQAACVTLTHGLTSGTTADVAVTATNPAGGSTTATTALEVDLTAPAPPAAFTYGTAQAPVAAQRDRHSVRAEWSGFAEPESGPVRTEVCVGTAQGQCDLRRDAVGAATAVHYAGLPALPAAVWLRLEACNGAGLCLAWEPAAPLVVDANPPTVTLSVAGPTQCVPGFPCETVWVTDAGGLTATLAVQDAESGLDACAWGVGGAPGGDNHMPFRPAVQGTGELSLTTALTATQLALPEGVPLSVTVRCWDRAGHEAAADLPLAVLLQAPGADDAVLRLSAAAVPSAASVTATWSGFDALSPALVEYAVAVGSALGLQDLSGWSPAQSSPYAIDAGAFPEGAAWVQVRARYPTRRSAVVSHRLVVDNTAPVPGVVTRLAVAPAVPRCLKTASRVDLQWSGFADALSDIAAYDWALVPSGAAPAWQPRGRRTYASLPETERAPGAYEARVRATDGAGHTAEAALGLYVDASPPVMGGVAVYGAARAAGYVASTTEVWVEWGAASDAECGVVEYLVAIGSEEDSTTAHEYTSIGPASPARLQGLALAQGRCYVLTLVAVNGAGLGGRAYARFCVDATPPAPGSVYLQSPADDADAAPARNASNASSALCPAPAAVTWVRSPARLVVCAAGFDDPETPAEWAVRLVAGEDEQPTAEVVGWAPVAAAALAPGAAGYAVDLAAAGLALAPGAPYVVHLRSTNAAGLTRFGRSVPFYLDASAPVVAWFHFGNASAVVKCASPGPELRAQWVLMDPESGVDRCEWAVGSAAGAQDVMPYTAVSHEEGYVLDARAAVALQAGRQYFVSIRGSNKAGLEGEHHVEVPLTVVGCDEPSCLSAVRCV